MKFLGRRLVHAALLLWGVSALCFLFTQMAPGSFFDEMRLNPQISPQTLSALRVSYGLDQPLLVRYVKWMRSLAHGDLGYSMAYNTSVAPLLWTRAKHTLLLTTTATFLTWLFAVPLGVWSANCRSGWFDKLVAIGSSFLISVPEIVIAVALLAFAVRWRALPVGGMMSAGFDQLSTWGRLQDVVLRMLLPTSILVLAGIAVVIRHIRASVLEVLDADILVDVPGRHLAQQDFLLDRLGPGPGFFRTDERKRQRCQEREIMAAHWSMRRDVRVA